MNEMTQHAGAERETSVNSLHDLHGALAKVLTDGIGQCPPAKRARNFRALRRMVPAGGSLRYEIELIPPSGCSMHEQMVVRCYAAGFANSADVLLFQGALLLGVNSSAALLALEGS